MNLDPNYEKPVSKRDYLLLMMLRLPAELLIHLFQVYYTYILILRTKKKII